jgi:hypothetical protein
MQCKWNKFAHLLTLLTPVVWYIHIGPADPYNKSHNSQGQNRRKKCAPMSSSFKIHELASLFRTENIVGVDFDRLVWSF